MVPPRCTILATARLGSGVKLPKTRPSKPRFTPITSILAAPATPDYAADRGVHPGGIATGREHCNPSRTRYTSRRAVIWILRGLLGLFVHRNSLTT